VITVGELKTLLKDQPDDRGVVLSIDAEGNGYTPVVTITEALWYQDPQHAWLGDAYSADPEDYEDDQFGMPEGLPTVVVIEPLN
jgi:hypothetical protein